MDCFVFPGRKYSSSSTHEYSNSKSSSTESINNINGRSLYHRLSSNSKDHAVAAITNNSSVTVVVGEEKRVFVVDSFVLEEDPFQFLLKTMTKKKQQQQKQKQKMIRRLITGLINIIIDKEDIINNGLDDQVLEAGGRPVIFVDHVDAILFEHLLWLMYNDCPSFLELNLPEIIDFYAQDHRH